MRENEIPKIYKKSRFIKKVRLFFASPKGECYLCKSHLLELFPIKSLPLEYRLCCKCRSMIEILARNNFNYKEVCKSIDFVSDLIEFRNEKIKKKKLTKVNQEIFMLFNRTPLQEKEDIKNKLKKYFININ